MTWRVFYLRFLSNANTPSIIIFAAIKIPTTAPIIGKMAIFTCLKKYAHKINIQYISLNAIFKVKVSYLLYTLVPHSQYGNHLNSSPWYNGRSHYLNNVHTYCYNCCHNILHYILIRKIKQSYRFERKKTFGMQDVSFVYNI